ncbi:MAG: glycosyltransferase family 1 protein [Cyanobacteria bacterium J06639_18]
MNFWDNSQQIDETRLGNPHIVHANNFSCPRLNNARVIYTLYDVSFLDHPEFSSEANRWNCFSGVFEASLNADLIIAISNYSKKRFVEIFPHFPVERIKVVYLGSRFEEVGAEKSVSGLTPGEFLLCVGTLEPRKNLRTTLRAYRRYVDNYSDSKPLVLAGGQGWLEDDLNEFIENLGLSDRVHQLGYIDDSVLRWLYKNCWAFSYPSMYEGFGLPVLEAMSLGAPVITSNTTSLPEVGGDAVLYVNPENESELLDAFVKLRNSDLRAKLKEFGQNQAQIFGWSKTAFQVLSLYKEALEMPKRILSG